VADALLMVLEEEEGAQEALELLPSELKQEVSEEAVTMDMTSPSESVSSVLGPGVDSATKFSSDVTDRYSILGEIGVGGMGEVYKAKDLSLGREVALKFLSAAMIGDDNAMNLFLREARAAAALNHPTIVTVYDIGVLDGRPFICMEFVEGTDLATRLRDDGHIELGDAIGIAIQLARALDYAHERNVVHRDIKPSNVIQTSDDMVKILDFGLAKAIQGNIKKSTYVAGTPEYMSPEQLAGRKVDGRGDLFSLGVLLYELLTGALPFEGALRSSNFEPPSARAEWLSPAVDDVLRKALALAPVDRFQRGKEFIDALRLLEGQT
jgi:serine/threonine protein kinase